MKNVLIILASFIHCTLAMQALSVKLTHEIQSLSRYVIHTRIINMGDEPLCLVQDPNSLVSELPTDKFRVVRDDGTDRIPAFMGIRVKFVPSKAAALGACTPISQGESIDGAHDVGQIYDFSTSGQGLYTFSPASCSFLVLNGDGDGITSRILAQADTTAIFISDVMIHLASSPVAIGFPRRRGEQYSFRGCTPNQQVQIKAASLNAQVYAISTYTYLQAQTSQTTSPQTARYQTWFGQATELRVDTVLMHLRALMRDDFSSYLYDCTCTEKAVYAYVRPSWHGIVYLCPMFWKAPCTGTDSQAGTIYHEASHYTGNGGTLDYAYGQDDSRELAIDDPDDASLNADSHEYFAENPTMAP